MPISKYKDLSHARSQTKVVKAWQSISPKQMSIMTGMCRMCARASIACGHAQQDITTFVVLYTCAFTLWEHPQYSCATACFLFS